MATGNGGLHFEPTMDIGQIRQSSKEVKKEITDATRAIEGMGTAFDLMSDITKQDIKDQKQYISGLEKEYAKLENRIKSMPRGSARDALQGKANTLRHEIESEKEALNAMEIAVERNSKAHQSFRTQLRQVNQEMMELAANGQKDTDAYRALQAKAVELQKNMGLVSKELQNMASPTSGFQGVASGIAGVTGAFAAANGIMGLFGSSSENLNKIMARTQSLMAITMGLQQVANTLYEGSAFRVNVLAKVKGLFVKNTKAATVAEVEEAAALKAKAVAEGTATTATTAATTAQVAETAAATTGTVATKGLAGAFKMLGAAIKKVPVFGWIIAGVTALVTIVSLFVDKAKEAKKAMEELRKNTSELATKTVTSVELLSLKFNQLGDSLHAKQKFVKENADKFKELGVNVQTVADAENLLIKNKDAFVRAQIEKATALAATNMAEDLVAKRLELQLKKETTPRYVRGVAGVKDPNSKAPKGYIDNPDYKQLEKEISEYSDKINRMYNIAVEAEKKGVKELEKSGVKAWEDYGKDTAAAIRQAIETKNDELSALLNQLNDLTGGKKIKKEQTGGIFDVIHDIENEIEAKKAEIKVLKTQLTQLNGGKKDTEKKGVFDIIEIVEKLDQKLEELRVLKEKVRKTGIVDQDELDNLEEQIKKLEEMVAKFKELRDIGLVPKLEPIKAKQIEVKPNEVKIEPKEVEIMPQSISRWKFVWQDIKHYFEELDYAEVASRFGDIAHQIKEIGDAADNADLKDFAEGLEEVASLAGTVIQGFAQGGWVGALVNAIMWVGSSLLEMAKQDAEVGAAIENSYLATALQKINEMMQSFSDSDKWGAFFGDDNLADFESGLSALIAIKENIDYLNRSSNMSEFKFLKNNTNWLNAAGMTRIDPSERIMTYNDKGAFWNAFGATFGIMSLYDETASLTQLVEMMGYKADDLYDKYGNLNADVLQQILDTYPKLAEEDKEWIEAAIEFSNQYADAMQQVADYMSSLFGEVADTIADQMIDSFLESGQAAIDFGGVVSDVAKKMAKDIIKNLMYATTFKKLEDDIMDVIDLSNGMNEESAPIILGMMQSALTKLQGQMPFYQELLEILSPFFDGSIAEETAAASGNLLQSASQDSVSLLNGQLNAMRAYQGRMEDMMTQVLWSLANIRDDMNAGFGETVRHLQSIDNNTSENGSILHQLGIWLG